jgi:hypothetical protein
VGSEIEITFDGSSNGSSWSTTMDCFVVEIDYEILSSPNGPTGVEQTFRLKARDKMNVDFLQNRDII